ncbi:acyltransferase family protein [Acinetobacter baumannii]|uniref:acyltransferase family protein n=1 Tax=Acinetobacter baumannii TaxID=470 RepID=UPI002AFAFED8|nr:acyltransferase [Acinetobacter baumannii]
MINKKISDQLESLRGLSALIVLFAHAYQVFINPIYSGLSNIIGLIAQSSVMIFFVLSGFLISLSIQNNIKRNSRFCFASFITSRLNRIYAPLLFSLFIVIALALLAQYFFQSSSNQFINQNLSIARTGFTLTFQEVLAALTFTNGFIANSVNSNPVLWSLAYEFWYYILAGLIATDSKFSKFVALILFLLLATFSKTFALLSVVWFSGFLIPFIINNNFKSEFNLFGKLLYYPALVLSIMYVLNIKAETIFHSLILIVFQICFGLIFCSYLTKILSGRNTFPPFFKNSAKYSYTLYIIHFPIFLFIFGVFETKIVNSLITALIIALISSALLIFISKLLAQKIERIKLIHLNQGIKTHVAAPPPVGGDRA